MSSDSLWFPDCVRTDCEAPRLDGLDLCKAHHQEIVMGLDECKARECDKRVPFGSLWCVKHKAMREAGNLSATGERLDLVDEATPCRLCGDAALRRTVGKRAQGGWNDLCQKHYDEKRKTHAGTLAVARAAIPRGDAKPKRVSIPDRIQAGALDASPDAEVQHRSDYLLANGWATFDPVDTEEPHWFLPVNVRQPANGRTLDEAYDWQVGIEASRHGADALDAPAGEGSGSEPSPSGGAPRAAGESREQELSDLEAERRELLTAAGWTTDEESGRWWRPVNEMQPHGGRTLEAAVAYQRNLDLGSEARVEILNEEGGHAGEPIREAILKPVMDWQCYADPGNWTERAAILVTIGAEIDHLEQELAVLRARWHAFAAVPSAE